MSEPESDQEYFRRKRKETWKKLTPNQRTGLTEAEWCEKAYHWHLGGKYYHSYSDYYDD